MTYKRELYCADQSFNWKSVNLSYDNSGFFTPRRPYDLKSIFNENQEKNLSPSMKTLIDERGCNPSFDKTDSESWLTITNPHHMMYTSRSDNVSYGWMEFVTGTKDHHNTFGTGYGFKDIEGSSGGYGFYLPNVVGMTFTWGFEGYWTNREAGCAYFGMNYYSPSRRKYRTVRFNRHSSFNQSNGSTDYYSPEGDRWQWRGGDLGNLSGGASDSAWNPVSASLSEAAVKKVIEEDWYWCGIWFEIKAKGRSGKSNAQRKVKIADVQPIFGPYIGNGVPGPRCVLPAPEVRSNGNSSQNFMTKGMYLNWS